MTAERPSPRLATCRTAEKERSTPGRGKHRDEREHPSFDRIVHAVIVKGRRETPDELFPFHSTNGPDQAQSAGRPRRLGGRARGAPDLGCVLARIRQGRHEHHVAGDEQASRRRRIERMAGGAPPVQLRRTARLSSLAGIPSVATTPRAVSIMSLTPAQLFAGALGGYALPNEGPTIESVLSTMSPETRRYTESVMNLTIEQLAAGAAGHP